MTWSASQGRGQPRIEGSTTKSGQTNASSSSCLVDFGHKTREGVAGCRFFERLEREPEGRTSVKGLTIAKLCRVGLKIRLSGSKDPDWTLPAR